MAAVYLYDKPIPTGIKEKVLLQYISLGFEESKYSSDNSHILEAESGESIMVDSEGIRFFPNGRYLEDIIEKTEEFRKLLYDILHDIDPEFAVYTDILMVTTSHPDPTLFNVIVNGYRVRYECEKYKNGRRKPHGRTYWKLKYLVNEEY